MKNKKQKRLLLCLCCAMMFSATAVGLSGCNKKSDDSVPGQPGEFYFDGDETTTADDQLLTFTEDTFAWTVGGVEVTGSYTVSGNQYELTLGDTDETVMVTVGEGYVVVLDGNGNEYTFLEKVSYDVVVKDADGTVISTSSVLNGKKFAKPADPEKAGYVFVGWYKDAACTEAYDFNAAITKNTDVYASFKAVYSVTVKGSEGSTLFEGTLTDGDKFAKPADPVKDGYTFIAWYKDADYKELYDFDAPVTKNTTIYALFAETPVGAIEFDVELVVDGATTATLTTVGGGLYFLPTPEKEGATFAGWWVSHYDDANKLSYKYEDGMKLGEPTKLYAVWVSEAPAVDVKGNKITWVAAGEVSQYTVKVTDPNGEVVQDMVSFSSFTYDFVNKAAGDYVIEISANGTTTTVYYQNKGLDKVSAFNVEGFATLQFNAVANAEKYLVTVVCGNPDHVHTVDNGNSTTYNFDNCTMTKAGVKFIVEAVADGYVSSVSAEYVYTRDLGAISEVKVDDATASVSWDAVPNATSYVVEIVKGDNVETINVGGDTSYSLKYYTGKMVIKVYPVAANYNSPDATSVEYDKVSLPATKNLAFDGANITWDEVVGAAKYVVKIGDKEFDATTNALVFPEAAYVDGQDSYAVSVKVVDGAGVASVYSDELVINLTTMSSKLTYEKGVVTWSAVFVADHYAVKVNDGAEMNVVKTSTSAAVTLTKEGENTISVCYYDADGKASDWVSMTVTAYEISFDALGGEEVAPIYKAYGDPMDNLPTTTLHGYDFEGWYTQAEDGTKYEDVYYTAKANTTLYAKWLGQEYEVTFDVGLYGVMEEKTAKVRFGSDYTLPVATSQDTTKVFGGWYTEPNGQGFAYTDVDGKSVRPWADTQSITLYAAWIEVLKYQLIDDETAYSVSQNEAGMQYTSYVRIPEKYNGLPVKLIEADAFKNCKTLKKIEIPDTITGITLGVGGYTASGSAFYGCSELEEISVYCVKGDHEANPHQRYYETLNGALIFNDPNNKDIKELIYVPNSLQGEYEIPYGVTHISANVFKSTKFTKVTIPSTVTYIGKQAFYMSTTMNFVFAKTPEDVEEVELTIDEGAFQSCDFTAITLPARLKEFNVTAFKSCADLAAVYIDGENGKYTSTEDGMLCEAVKDAVSGELLHKKIVYCPVARAGAYTIPMEVREIGDGAFQDCEDLTEITIPGHVTKIGAKAFYSCGSLAKVNFAADGLGLEIGEQAFYSCSALTELHIPASVKVIGTKAFQSCSGITKLTFADDATAIIGDSAFYALKNFTELVIPKGITKIGASAFASTGITSVTFMGQQGDLGLTIDEKAFFSCTALTEVTLPGNLEHLAAMAFGSNSKLTTVYVEVGGSAVIANAAFGSALTASAKYYVQNLYIGKDAPALQITGIFGTESLKYVDIHEENANFMDIDGVVFSKDETQLLYYPAAKEGEYVIPEKVQIIGANVFEGKTGLTKITIGHQVTEIGEYAFDGCSNLEEVVFLPVPVVEGEEAAAERVTLDIGQYAFNNCKKLTTIELPVGTRTIGTYAFSNCIALPSINIPDGVTELNDRMFSGCDLLTTIKIPASVASMGTVNQYSGALVFYGCDGLAEIIVDEKNETFMSIDGLLYQRNEETKAAEVLMYCPTLKAGKVTVPASVTQVWDAAFSGKIELTEVVFEDHVADEDGNIPDLTFGDYTFYYGSSNQWGAMKLEKIVLPEGMTNIPTRAFYYAKTVKEIVIPTTVTTIQPRAFYELTNLEKLTFTEGGKDDLVLVDGTSEGGSSGPAYYYGVFNNMNSTKLSTITLPERTKTIGKYAFYDMTSLTSIVIPKGVTEIGMMSFYSCDNLTSVTFAEGSQLEKIGYGAFEYAPFTSITLPESLTTIGGYAFYQTKLESIEIPASVTIIGAKDGSYGDYSVFAYTKLKTVTFAEGSQLETISQSAFQNSTLLESIEIPASVKTIALNVFSGCTSLSSVTFAEGSNLESIGNTAFASTALTYFAFPVSTSNLDLGESLFSGCKLLTKVHLSKSVVNIDNVFSKCSAIKTVTIDSDNINFEADKSGLPLINGYGGTAIYLALGQIDGDTFIVPEGVREIGPRAFEGQPFKNIVLPSSLLQISDYAFYNCNTLESVTFKEGCQLETIGEYAFRFCSNLKAINLPDTVTEIGKYAFADCSGATTLKLPANIETLGDYAFAATDSLVSVEFPESLKTTGQYTFAYSGVESVKFNEGIEFLGAFAATPTYSTNSYLFLYCDNLKKVELPSSLKGIGQYTFAYCSSLEDITLPANLELIGQNAFRGSGLKSFTVPANVTILYNYILAECPNLTSVTFHDGITELKQYVFKASAQLTDIVLPTSVTKIGSDCFYGTAITTMDLSNIKITSATANLFRDCTKLTSVTLHPDSTNLGNYFFAGCTSLETVTIPSGIKYLGTYTFQGCTALKEITLPSAMTLIGTSATAATNSSAAYTFQDCTSLTTVNGLEKITKMSKGVFAGCTSLAEVNLAACTQIGYENFMGCTALKNVVLPKVTSVGANAFDGCTSLESIEIGAKVTSVGKYAFGNCPKLTTVTMNDTSTSVGTYAFAGCTSLKEFAIPSGVSSLGEGTFDGCTALTSVTQKTLKLTSIGKYAFRNCTAYTNAVLPTTVKTINDFAFVDSGITSIQIPKTVTSMNGSAFAGCKNLTSVTIADGNTYFKVGANGAIYSADGTKLVYYPVNSGSDVADLRNLGIKEISKYAFAGNLSVKTVYLPDDMVEIADYAFAECTSLVTVIMPDTLEIIGDHAFDGCTALTNLTLPANLKTINTYAFANCLALTEVTIPEGVTDLANYVFDGSGITKINLPATLKTIGTYVFRGTMNLGDVVIPTSVYSIGNYAFNESGLTSFTWKGTTDEDNAIVMGTYMFKDAARLHTAVLPEGLLKLTTDMFRGAASLKNVTLPSTLTNLAGYAFAGTALEAITLPEGLLQIENNAFLDCTSLKSIKVPSTVTKIDWYAFANCTALATIDLPEGLTEFGREVFLNCTAMKEITLPESLAKTYYGMFSGWTAEQTIYIKAARVDVNKGWTYSHTISSSKKYLRQTWLTNGELPCDAKVIYV